MLEQLLKHKAVPCVRTCEHKRESQDGVDPAGARRMYTVLCYKGEVRDL